MFIESLKTQNIITGDGTDRTTSQMTLENIQTNVVDTGELIMVDY
jgi:hypothetical protein